MDPIRQTSNLIISLEHNLLGVTMPSAPDGRRRAEYAVSAFFRPNDVAAALDQALADHPHLFGPPGQVDVLVMDSPHTLVPAFVREEREADRLIRKYLRVRYGEFIITESTAEGQALGYTMACELLGVVREYFAEARPVHLAAVLWHAVSQAIVARAEDGTGRKLWLIPFGNCIAILYAEDGKRLYSRVFHVHAESDAAYFALAAYEVLKPDTLYWVSLTDQDNMSLPETLRHVSADRLHMASLAVLIDEFRKCGS